MNSVPLTLEKNNIDELYRKNQVKSISFLVILSCVLLLAILVSLRAGSYETPIAELIKGVFGRSSNQKVNIVVRHNRLLRIFTALFAGGGLGLAGCILQAVLRNPLASSSTLGVSQGATFGAAFAIVVLGLGANDRFGIPMCAPWIHCRSIGNSWPEQVPVGIFRRHRAGRCCHQFHVHRRNHPHPVFCG